MIRPLVVGLAIFALSNGGFAQARSDTSSSSSPLFQVMHLTGEKNVGFKKSCLLLYGDGQYHRETTRQEAVEGRASGEWQPTQVFESTIPIAELEKVREIVDSKDFRAVDGTLGTFNGPPLRLVSGGRGVFPGGDIDIFEASVAHPSGPQVFSVLWSTALRHSESPVKSFATWIDEVEKRKEGRLNEAAANNCSSPRTGTSSGFTKHSTILMPRAIFTPDPDYPPSERKAKHAGTVVAQILVNVDGSVGQLSVKHGTNPKLNQSALDAIKKWKFAPARLVGVPVPIFTDVEVGFYLY